MGGAPDRRVGHRVVFPREIRVEARMVETRSRGIRDWMGILPYVVPLLSVTLGVCIRVWRMSRASVLLLRIVVGMMEHTRQRR